VSSASCLFPFTRHSGFLFNERLAIFPSIHVKISIFFYAHPFALLLDPGRRCGGRLATSTTLQSGRSLIGRLVPASFYDLTVSTLFHPNVVPELLFFSSVGVPSRRNPVRLREILDPHCPGFSRTSYRRSSVPPGPFIHLVKRFHFSPSILESLSVPPRFFCRSHSPNETAANLTHI